MLWHRTAVAVLAGTTVASVACSAVAHGGIPRAVGIHVAPDSDERIVVKSDAWGLFRTDDAGSTWSWVCAESYGGDSLGVVHPSIAALPGGAILVANFGAGLRRGANDACSWTSVEQFDDLIVEDVYRAPDGSIYVLTFASRDETLASLWRSTDSAKTFTVLDAMPGASFLPRSVSVAKQDAARLYVVGSTSDDEVVLLTSNDGGSSWKRTNVGQTTRAVPRIVSLNSDPDLLFLRLDELPASQNDPDPGDNLLLSQDGGKTWSSVVQATQDLPGIAVSPDEQTFAVAGPADGLRVAPLVELLENGGVALTVANEAPAWALAWTDAGLFVGYDDFASEEPRFTVGVSRDEGRTIEPLMHICDVGLPECDQGADTLKACTDVFERLGGFRNAILESPRCRPPNPDAGSPEAGSSDEPAPKSKGGCGCSFASTRRGKGWPPFSLLVVAVLAGRRYHRPS